MTMEIHSSPVLPVAELLVPVASLECPAGVGRSGISFP